MLGRPKVSSAQSKGRHTAKPGHLGRTRDRNFLTLYYTPKIVSQYPKIHEVRVIRKQMPMGEEAKEG